jgi:hypothetical protein
MNGRELFDLWAPLDEREPLPWSRWAKPILFQELDGPAGSVPAARIEDYDLPWAPSPSLREAIVVDLRGSLAVEVGVALARLGYRPVPVFNAAPPPSGVTAVIDTDPIVGALRGAADALASAHVPDDAPPAFLLDVQRDGAGVPRRPGMFDNRWVVLPQDLPSADLLKARGLRGVVLVHAPGFGVQEDVAHVLLRWQRAGLALRWVEMGSSGPPLELVVPRPKWFRWLLQAAIVTLGLRATAAGAFGGLVPRPSSGS